MRVTPVWLRRTLPLFACFVAKVAAAQEPVTVSPPPPVSSDAPPPTPPSPSSGAWGDRLLAPRPDYVGTTAPPTTAGTTPLAPYVRPGLEAFAQYAYTQTYPSSGSTTWFQEFSVPRVHASMDAEYETVRARIVLEGVESANEGALTVVGGDSIVLRIREAYAGWTPLEGLEGLFGVVPTLTIPEFEGTWLLRVIAPTTLETTGLASPADLGGTIRYRFPRKYGWIALGAYNGEGYTSPELNRGKNVEIAAELHPFPQGDLLPLALFGSYVEGSSGSDSAQSNRATAALLWQGRRVRAGVDFTYASGVGDDAVQSSVITEGFVRVEPIDRLLLGAQASYWIRSTTSASTDAITTVTGSVGWRIASPLEVHVAMTRALPTAYTDSELTGADYLQLRLATRVVF